jgi:hypothetical protein
MYVFFSFFDGVNFFKSAKYNARLKANGCRRKRWTVTSVLLHVPRSRPSFPEIKKKEGFWAVWRYTSARGTGVAGFVTRSP